MKLRWLGLVLVLFAFTALLPAEEPKLDPRIKAGNEFTIEYPDMPLTLAYEKAKMWVYLPEDYDSKKQHPLFLWYNGGDGQPGIGTAKNIADHKLFICVSFPLFKPNPPTPEQRKVDQWAGLYLVQSDADINWTNHKIMLDDVYKLIPNISPNQRVVGGFSNGGHITGYLVNHLKEEFFTHFDAVYICEGGYQMSWLKGFKDKPIMVSWGEESQAAGKLSSMPTRLKAAGAIVATIPQPATGHDMKPEFYPQIREWLNNEVICSPYKPQLDKIELLTKARKYGDAIGLINELRTQGAGTEPVIKAADARLQVIDGIAKAEFERMTKREAKSDYDKKSLAKKLEKFIKAFDGTATAAQAAELLTQLNKEVE